jgi:glycine cleavage system H protein
MEDDVMEFSVAHNRKYSKEHVWYQEKDERLVIGISDFLAEDIGEILRVILRQAENEIDVEESMFSIWTAEEKLTFPSPFSGMIDEVNGEVEISPDLVNDSPYDLGWVMILNPHELDMENLLDADEYVEYLAEL